MNGRLPARIVPPRDNAGNDAAAIGSRSKRGKLMRGDSNPYRRGTSDPTQMPYNPCAARVCDVLTRPPRHPKTTLKTPDLPPKSRISPGWSGFVIHRVRLPL